MTAKPKGQPETNHGQDKPQPPFPSSKHHGHESGQKNAITRFHGLAKKYADLSAPYIVLVGILGGIFAVKSWMENRIDSTVERKLSDETILRRIAAQSRPVLLFDANESITADMGASGFIKNIQIIEREKDGWPRLILIDFLHHISNALILTTVNESARIHANRAKGFAWKFQVEEIVQHHSDTNTWIFRLEILP